MTSGDKMEEAIQSKKSILLEYLKVIVITLIVTYGILYFVQISRVYGTSMIPTYHEGNIVLVDKVFYKNKEPKRNDIIVVDYVDAAKKETYIIKRVIGIGGDHIDIKDIVTFGDADNDVEMMQAVGTGIAMGRHSEKVGEVASMVTGTVKEEGITMALKKLGLI